MVFSSLSFLYLFLPLCLMLYFVSKNRVWQNTVLLVFSLVFYAWGEPKLIVMMLLSTLVAYLGGMLMHRAGRAGATRRARVYLIGTVVLLVLNLGVFKYFNFISENIQLVLGAQWDIARIRLPIGISFYTFQILSYVIDLWRGRIRLQKNYFYLLLYVCFFPQLIAGPIVRYQTVEDEIEGRDTRFCDIVAGLKRFIIGLSKKVIIANNVAALSTTVWEAAPGSYSTLFWWLAALSYTLQIYFDFSGYSDMAIGLGRVFGFHFDENFNYPYLSCSITEFWRRWHISLGSWFRDYIYIPMGGNRKGRGRWVVNILTVWALTGFWHGAAWNFLLWGVYYGALLLIEKLFLTKLLKRLPAFVRWGYTMLAVIVGWVLFSQTTFTGVWTALVNMFSFSGVPFINNFTSDASVLINLAYLPLGMVCSLPIAERVRSVRCPERPVWAIAENTVYLALLALCIVFITASSFNPFIYFRF